MAETTKPQSILVKNPNGEIGYIPIDQAKDALAQGYQVAAPEEAKDAKLQEQYGEGFGNELQAFGEGALRGLSIGTSDPLLKTFGLSEEGLKQRQERNPVASGAGEVAGIALPLAASALAGPEAPAAIIAARTPVGLLARGSAAAGEALTTAMGVSRAAEGASLASRVLARAASPALGSAIEGAAYGLGQSVSEDALGDHGLNAERLISNVGLGGLFGGALGGIFGAFTKNTPEKIIEESIGRTQVNPENINEVAKATGLEKEGFISGLGRKKAGSAEIEQAAERLGAPIAPGMVSGNEQIQRLTSLIQKSPTAPAIEHANIYRQGYEIAENAVQDALGARSGLSLAQTGEAIKEGLTKQFEAKIAPTRALYDQIEESTRNVLIPEKTRLRMADNMRKLIKDEEIIDEPSRQLIRNLSDRIGEIQTLDGLKKVQTSIGQAVSSNPGLRYLGSVIDERLDSLRLRMIKKYAEELPAGEARDLATSLLNDKKIADKQYKALRSEMETVGKSLFGGKKIYGPSHFLSLLEDSGPEKFAERLFQKKNAAHLDFMQRLFPEETRLLARYQKDQILRAADKVQTGKMNAIFRKVDELEPEAKRFLFTPEEIQKIKDAKTYIHSFPKDFNPSGTAAAHDTLQFFTNPIAATTATARDIGMLSVIKGLGPQAESKVQALSTIERMVKKTGKAIEASSRRIVQGSERATDAIQKVKKGALGGAFLPRDEQKKKEEKTISFINDLSVNPQKLVDKLDSSLKDVTTFAPKIAGSMSLSATQAVQFLASVAPKTPNMGPLAPKFELSSYDVAKFQRYSDVVDNPLIVMDQIEHGMLTQESMTALKTVYPAIYSDMKKSLMSEIGEKASKDELNSIPYQTKMNLSLFFGEDLMQSISQQNIMMNQIAMASLGKEQAKNDVQMRQSVSQKGLSSISKANQMMTPMQASANRANMEG